MERLHVTFTGLMPLLLHSDRGVNPLDPIRRQLNALTSKRKKTDEDHAEIARLDFLLGLPVDAKDRPAIPAYQVKASIRDGAKRTKNGTNVRSSIFVHGADRTRWIPLIYDGPKTAAELVETPRFVDTRTVGMQKKRVMRTRPIFDSWSLEFDMEYDPVTFNADTIEQILEQSGMYVGLGDYRPEFGRYQVETKKLKRA